MNIQLRKATIGDLQFLFNLRNEEAVRKASFNSDPISLETHRNWLEKKLAGNDSVLYVAEENSQPIAQVRFDRLNDGRVEISIAVTESFRGRGYGSEILRRASFQFFQEFPECNAIYALIKPDNKSSMRSFEKAGYRFVSETDHNGQMCMEMILNRPV